MRHSTHELNDVYRKGDEFLTVNITTANADRALYQPKRCTLFIRFFFTGSHHDAHLSTEKFVTPRLTGYAQ